jgi:hypothetical protein
MVAGIGVSGVVYFENKPNAVDITHLRRAVVSSVGGSEVDDGGWFDRLTVSCGGKRGG